MRLSCLDYFLYICRLKLDLKDVVQAKARYLHYLSNLFLFNLHFIHRILNVLSFHINTYC